MSKSVVTQYESISAFSGAQSECRHHLIFGTSKRELAEKHGLWIPLTNSEHNMSSNGLIYQIHENPAAEKLSKIAGQLAFEKEFYKQKCNENGDPAREQFRRIFGESFL